MQIVKGANLIINGDQLIGGVYIGSIRVAMDQRTLKNNNIRAVVSVVSDRKIQYDEYMAHLYHDIEDDEDENISKYFDSTFEFIEQQRKKTNVLVHCLAGISRSATIVIAYMMRKNGMSYNEAHEIVKSKRKIIRPNPGFQLQLKQFEKKLYGKL